MSSTSTATPSKLPYDRRLEDAKHFKRVINSTIMDFFVSQGFPYTAQMFATEANIPPTAGVDSIHERVEIREAIHSGNIQTAIEKINELNPLLLERDQSLHFALLRLQLVEHIRDCIALPVDDPKTLIAINFAETELAPRAPTNPQFMDDLERTMVLLIFDRSNLPAQYAVVLEPEFRRDLAQRVNEALLKEQGWHGKAKLGEMLALRAWAAVQARETKKELPEHLGRLLGESLGM